MNAKLIYQIIEHKNWLESLGRYGQRLILDTENMCGIHNCYLEILMGAWIKSCVFNKMCIQDSDLYYSKLFSCHFVKTNLNEISFSHSLVRDTNFNHSMISSVNFYHAEIDRCIFRNCKIDNVSFKNAIIFDTDFRNTQFNNVNFQQAHLDNILVNENTKFINCTPCDLSSITIKIKPKNKILPLSQKDSMQWIQENILSE